MSMVVRNHGLILLLCLLIVAGGTRVCADEADDDFAVASGHYAQQRWKFAAEAFESCLKKYPDHAKADQARFLFGETLLQLGRTEEAGKFFRDYLARAPKGEYARTALFRAGEVSYLCGQFDAAKTDLDKFLAAYPDDKLNSYVLPYLGDIELGRGNVDAAVKHFRMGLDRFPTGRLQDDCRFGLARALEKQNQHEEAERLFLAVAGKTGNSLAADAQFHLGAAQYAAGKYDQAIETFQAFEGRLAKSPWRANARMGRGWALLKLNRLDAAKPVFQSLSADPKLGIDAQYWLGLTEKAAGNYKTAAQTLMAATAAAPKHALNASMHYHAGDALLKAGDSAGAQGQFDLAVAAGPQGNESFDAALRGKVQAALDAKDYDAVDRNAAYFEARAAQSPLKKDVARLQARAYLERKDFDAAAKLLEPLVHGAEQGAQALEDRYLLAVAYEEQKRYDDALALLQPVLAEGKDRLRADALLRQGSVLVAKRNYADAVAPLEAFLGTQPKGDAIVKAGGELAICYARTGKVDRAKKLYGELARRYPKHELLAITTEQLAEAAFDARDAQWSEELFGDLRKDGGKGGYELKGLAGEGWSQFKAGEFAKAAESFDQVLKKDPPAALAAEAALVRGQALEKLSKPDAALVMYDLLIDKYPKAEQHPHALLAAARLRDKLQQDQQAADLYERLATQYPQYPKLDTAIYEWAWVMQELGKPDSADQLFERLRKDFPQSRFAIDASYRLAQQAFVRKDYARAKGLVQELLGGKAEKTLREHCRSLLGQIAAAEQNWDEARGAFEELIREFPESRQRLVAEFWIAETYYRKGQYVEAQKRFDALATKMQGGKDVWLAMIPLRRAQVLAQQKQWKEAQAIAEKIEKDFPKFDQQYEVDYLMGRCLHAAADMAGARERFQRVTLSSEGAKTETAAMAQFMIGETYFHQKNYSAAIFAYLRLDLLYAFPKWRAGALLQAGKCHELLGEQKEAVEVYNRILSKYPETTFAPQAREKLRSLSGSATDVAAPK